MFRMDSTLPNLIVEIDKCISVVKNADTSRIAHIFYLAITLIFFTIKCNGVLILLPTN